MKYLRRLDNLYITFTPPVVRNISPRKLSVTLGAKAAHHPLLVMVDEQAQLPSDLWLARDDGTVCRRTNTGGDRIGLA